MNGDFYGKGFLFPLGTDPADGSFATVGKTDIVAQALRILLRTRPGERLMRPEYGCDLRRYLFAPNTVATRRLIAEDVTRAIAAFEDRVVVQAVDVTADEIEPAQVNIVIRYAHRRTGDVASLTQPFRLDGAGS